MPPIDTGVPADRARPQTFHRFSYISGGGQLTPLTQSLVVMGTMGAGGQGVAGTVYEINSIDQADLLFVKGSEVALMVRQAADTQVVTENGPRILAVGAVEPAAGAKATFTLTITGPATESGNLVLKAMGRRFKIGVAKDDIANDIAQAVVDMFTAHAAELPFTVARVNGVVTATYNHKGTNGNDLVFELESKPAGVGCVIADGVAGAGALDLSACYDALEGIDIDGYAPSTRSTDDVADALAHNLAMWDPAEKKWRWAFFGDTETLATATALATAANDRSIVVASCEGCPAMPFQVAVSVAVAAMSRTLPNAIFNKVELPLPPPAIASAYNGTEVEAGIAAGVTILTPVERRRLVIQDRLKIERLVTTKTLENNQPFLKCRDIGVPRTGAYAARQLDILYEQRFGAQANPNGALMDEDADDRVRDLVAAVWHELAANRILKNVDADLQELKVEPDDEADGRMDVDTAMSVVLGMHQVAYNHRVKVGG